MKLSTVTPPLVAQDSAPRCGGGHLHPHMILILSLAKCAFFWQTAGFRFFLRAGFIASETPTSALSG
jgi:hypothetical protein